MLNCYEAMLSPVAAEAREGYRIWLRFADGVEGELDVSQRTGRFSRAFISPTTVLYPGALSMGSS